MLDSMKIMNGSSTTRRRRYYVTRNMMFILFFSWFPLFILMTTTTTLASSTGSSTTNFPLPGVEPDKFVTVAPMIVGVVCNDGVLLLALHTAFGSNDNNNNNNNNVDDDDDDNNDHDNDYSSNFNHQSFLLRKEHDLPKPMMEENNSTTTKNATLLEGLDIPNSYRGPFRIYPIDGSSTKTTTTAMVCAGWRSDGQRLANIVRSIDREECSIFGTGGRGTPSSSASPSRDMEYGSYLAGRASQKLAEYAVTSGRRPLSCVSLMATSSSSSSAAAANGSIGNQDQNQPIGGHLWLVDATGTYRVRAHAVGGGTIPASQMNAILAQKDWTKQRVDDTARELLQILFDDHLNDHEQKATRVTGIPTGTLVEMAAIVGGGGSKPSFQDEQQQEQIIQQRRGMKRLFASTLFGRPSTSPVAK